MQLASCQLPAAAAGRSGGRPSWTTTTPPALTVIVKKPAVASSPTPTRAARCRCSSSGRDEAEFGCGGDGGGLVDEMRAAERNWEPPEEWAAWEKEWYGTYDADVCELAGALRAFLVSSRPGVGVGLLAVLVLAVPASAFALVSHLLDASRAIISNLHH